VLDVTSTLADVSTDAVVGACCSCTEFVASAAGATDDGAIATGWEPVICASVVWGAIAFELAAVSVAIAPAETSSVAPKTAGLTSRDFHNTLDIFLFSSHLCRKIDTPYLINKRGFLF
jgi:hypothetical protein